MSQLKRKDTVKLLYKLDSIYKREAHSGLYQTSEMELMRKCLIWYYEYTLGSEYSL